MRLNYWGGKKRPVDIAAMLKAVVRICTAAEMLHIHVQQLNYVMER